MGIIFNTTLEDTKSDTEYERMPRLMHMDSYEACQRDTDALYCSAEFALVSDKPNSLLDMIREYSEHHVGHYNHTKLRYSICVTQTCKQFYGKDKDPKLILEECLDQMLLEKYQLKVIIEDEYFCKHPGMSEMDIDKLDIMIGVMCLIFLILNLVGSICEMFYNKDNDDTVHRILLCFSLKRNWKKLFSGAEDHPRLQILKGLHGVRALTMALVIMAHSMLGMVAALQNPEFLEEIYTIRPFYILLNGMLIMHTFLMMSSFLLVYKSLIHAEKNQINWNMLPKLILNRWLRLTPSYAIVLALTATWFRHVASGPLWGKYVATEMRDCRRYWWQHILYINNYLYNTKCMVQTWYLAVDMQLYIFAVIIFLACTTARSRKITLSLLLVIGMIIPAGHVYFQDLDGIQIISPELILSVFFTDPHFNHIYKRGHTNTTGYVIGMAMAFLVHHWQKQGANFKKYQTFTGRLLYRSLFLLALLCCYIGCIYYAHAPRPSVYINIVYAAFSKPAFALFIGGIIIGCIFKFEDLYRSILEWHWWTIPSRLSYNAYLLHVVVIRSYVAALTETIRHNYISMLTLSFNILIRSFAIAFVFWLLVEAPINNIVKKGLTKTATENKRSGMHTIKSKRS